MALVVTLPYPISANRYWASRIVTPKDGKPFVSTYVTPEAKQYKESVAWLLKAKGVREVLPGRMTVHLRLYPNRPQDYRTRMRKHGDLWDDTVMRLDLDNARKVVYDALKDIVFADDKCIFKDTGEVMEPDGREACVMVAIEPYVRTPTYQTVLDLPAHKAIPKIVEPDPKLQRMLETPF